MPIIKSNIDKYSSNYISNYNYNKKIASELQDLKNKISQMGPQQSVKKHTAKGKLNVRERIELLKDNKKVHLLNFLNWLGIRFMMNTYLQVEL